MKTSLSCTNLIGSLISKVTIFLDYSLCHFELVEFLKLLFVIMAFFHILVVKERRKQNKSVLGSVMLVLLHIYSPE